MRRQWITWAVIALIAAAPLWLAGAKCKNTPPAEGQPEEQQEEKKYVRIYAGMDTMDLCGVPVYPHEDPASWQSDLQVSNDPDQAWGHYYGSVSFTTTCPPENVERWYDEALKDQPGLEKDSGPTYDARYRYTNNYQDSVAITVKGGPEGSTITVTFNY